MKKFALAAVAAAALSAGVAQAYTVGTFSDGVVVPNVIHNGPTDTTAVGLINQTATVIPVFWTFFDQNSNHVTDGCFPMTPKDYEPFVWSSASGLGLEGKRGYLVFAVGLTPAGISVANACQAANSAGINGAGLIAANAFQVDATNKDVAFIPVIDGPLGIIGDLSIMGPNSLLLRLALVVLVLALLLLLCSACAISSTAQLVATTPAWWCGLRATSAVRTPSTCLTTSKTASRSTSS